MATSDSEDFESADEGFDGEDSPKKKPDTKVDKPTEQISTHPEPQPAQPTQEKLQQEEPVADSAWEPEDLDDDILDSINDKVDEEEPVMQINKSVKELSIADKPVVAEPEPKKSEETSARPNAESEIKKVDAVDEPPPEPESNQSRPRRVREAKAISKVASAGSKKLGSKLATPVSLMKPEDDETQNTSVEQPKSNSNFADNPTHSCNDESEDLPSKPDDVNQRLDRAPDKPAVSSVLDKLSSTLEQQPDESSVNISPSKYKKSQFTKFKS